MNPTPSEAAGEPQVTTEWRGPFKNSEVNLLHAECFEHRLFEDDWWAQVNRISLGWVCLRQATNLIGFVNVAWDGAVHAFVLDTMITTAFRRQGLATDLIREAVERAREAGCEWLHVDFDPHLRSFYFDACGFRPTDAGLIPLK
ncbi:GNAT family N-acetyltransferase [Pseudaminobacter soli (ex Li et al. 2025)]|uniref:GNAT family N-acetyltransferase n=1 Tax=Pseudaminobacter soli (ex Li et al. 2025) TaxID=1295366 RepID=UPI0024761024|nr:GNAT family N-acetyltransferase [Mesorhizobium soli]